MTGMKTILYILLLSIVPLLTVESGTVKKTHRIRHHRHKTLPPVDTTITPPDIVDTSAFESITEIQRNILTEINRWGNVRYHRGGMTKQGVDCSGFTCRIFRDAADLTLPRTSRGQSRCGLPVTPDSLTLGDLLFFSARIRKHRISHVGIYLTDGKFIHSSRTGIRVDSLTETYYERRFVTARRVLTEADSSAASSDAPGG